MSKEKSTALRIARTIVDSISLNEQVLRFSARQNKNETYEYLTAKVQEIGRGREAESLSMDLLYKAFVAELASAIQAEGARIGTRMKEDRESLELVDLDRDIKLMETALHPRTPNRFADWLDYHGVSMADLKRTGAQYDYLCDVFIRAGELERIDRHAWKTRTLLERAELELFDDDAWIRNVSMSDGPGAHTWFERKPLYGVEAIYENAAESISLALRSYLRDAKEGLPLYTAEGDRFVEIQGMELAELLLHELTPGGAITYREPPEWARRLYHKHTDVYWHNLLSGDMFSSNYALPRDSARIYSQGRPPHEVQRRQLVIRDQENARRAALRAVVEGKIELNALALPTEAMEPSNRSKTSYRAEKSNSQEALTSFEEFLRDEELSYSDILRGEQISPYILTLFERAEELARASGADWDYLSLRELAEKELFRHKLLVFGASVEDRVRQLYESAAQQLALSINIRCYDFLSGLPLYEKTGTGWKKLSEDSGTGANIAFMVRHNKEDSRCLQMDEWLSHVYVKADDERAFALFFSDEGFSGEAAKVRKAALQRYLRGTLFTDETAGGVSNLDLQNENRRLKQEFDDYKDRSLLPTEISPKSKDAHLDERFADRIQAIVHAWHAAVHAKQQDGKPDKPFYIYDEAGNFVRVGDWLTEFFKKNYSEQIKSQEWRVSLSALVKICNWDTGGH